MNKAYITAAGIFLPGEPIGNEKIEDYLGKINGVPSSTKTKILSKNAILFRHYAMDQHQKSTFSNEEMAALAIEDCLGNSNVHKSEIDFLGVATTQGDIPVPGFASMVHGRTSLPVCEIASFQSVCASGMMALKNAYLQVVSGEKKNALACASELVSRVFRAERFEHQKYVLENGYISSDTEFLRWMLSDGAGAFLVQPKPSVNTISLEIEFIDIRSYATLFDVCMYAGLNKDDDINSWMDFKNFAEADYEGAINLKQDLKLVNNIVKLGVQRFFELIDESKIDPKKIDYLLCHYSSHIFKNQIIRHLKRGGLELPEEKWFTNLYTKGNTGAASIFIMVEALLKEKELKDGQEILCMVPESGRFLTSFMKLKVIDPHRTSKTYFSDPNPPALKVNGNPIQEWLIRQLTQVWIDFETNLNKVAIVEKINKGVLTIEEYKGLLCNLRQQVIDGSQWIARAASNISIEYFEIRSSFIRHSSDEHRDYLLLEKNFVNLGGELSEITGGRKNIGSEALSAYMFQRASLTNPFDLLGGMFIIEGLGNRLAGKWGRAIKEQLQLRDDQVSFLIYHESSDASDNHFERFENAIQSELLTSAIAENIVKTAKVVARLYTLQLEEINHF